MRNVTDQPNYGGHTMATNRDMTSARNALLTQIEQQRTAIAAFLPHGVDEARFFALARRAVIDQPELLECSTPSVLRALGACAASGLQLDGKFSSLIVRRLKQGRPTAHWDPSYRGMTYLALESGIVIDVQSGVVRSEDTFEFELGSAPKLRHVPSLLSKNGEVIAAYAVAKLRAGGQMIEILTRPDLEKIRAMSPAGDKGPWGNWADQMAQKSAVRRLLKRLPAGAVRGLSIPESFPVQTSAHSPGAGAVPLQPEDEYAMECTALQRLNEAGSLEDLQAAWAQVHSDYGQRGVDVPLAVEARWHQLCEENA